MMISSDLCLWGSFCEVVEVFEWLSETVQVLERRRKKKNEVSRSRYIYAIPGTVFILSQDCSHVVSILLYHQGMHTAYLTSVLISTPLAFDKYSDDSGENPPIRGSIAKANPFSR